MVNTSVNLPQSRDRSGFTRSDCKIAPPFTCPACPPSNAIHHLEKFATARLPVSLSLHGLLTSSQNQHTHQPGTLTFNIKNHLPDSNCSPFPSKAILEGHWLRNPDTAQKNTISINLFKPFLSLWCAALVSPGSETIMTWGWSLISSVKAVTPFSRRHRVGL
ncbi:hypothetical protein AMECASPLE_028408 [Ameca splendens]|uniref:Uncharacterized protein n=1 Tax=Ameca splendens TaxID=208324 RepID=A0ABV0ZF93_9TELE